MNREKRSNISMIRPYNQVEKQRNKKKNSYRRDEEAFRNFQRINYGDNSLWFALTKAAIMLLLSARTKND